MKDFLDDLEARLRVEAAAEAEAVRAEHAAARPPRRRWRRPAILSGATAALAAIASTALLTGTSMAELPILSSPTTDASEVARAAPQARRAGVDFSRAHTFDTPNGPGYVFVAAGAARQLCLAVPDEGDYPGSCLPEAQVERSGLAFEVVGDASTDPDAVTLFAFVLPAGAERVELVDEAGRSTRPTLTAGVVVAEVTSDVELRWRSGERRERRTVQGPFSATTTIPLECPDGRSREVPLQEVVRPGDQSGRIDPALRRRACR